MALRAEDQRSILHNSGARSALVESEICQTVLTGAREKLHQLTDVVVVERNGLETGPKTLKSLIAETSSSAVPEFAEPSADQAAFILYTSGSTGKPKGAVHRQADIFYTNESYCAEVLNLTTSERLFSSSRLPFAYGLGNSFTFPC